MVPSATPQSQGGRQPAAREQPPPRGGRSRSGVPYTAGSLAESAGPPRIGVTVATEHLLEDAATTFLLERNTPVAYRAAQFGTTATYRDALGIGPARKGGREDGKDSQDSDHSSRSSLHHRVRSRRGWIIGSPPRQPESSLWGTRLSESDGVPGPGRRRSRTARLS